MSWKSRAIRCTFSPGAAAESLPTFSKESSPSSPSKSRTSSEQSSVSVSPTCHCGTTCGHSEATTPNAPKPSPTSKSTATTLSLPGASLAKISLVLEKARDYAAREAACSMSTRGSFAKFDPVSYSWRIPLFLFTGELSRYSGKWPRWGMMVRGECYPLPTWADAIGATAFGERSGDVIEEPPAAESATGPTPTAHAAKHTTETEKPRDALNYAVERGKTKSHTYPTIGTKTMGGCSGSQQKLAALEKIGALRADERRVLQSGNGGVATCGYLNPDWVEWLMNWPLGWTNPDAAALIWLTPEDDPADLEPNADGYIPRITTTKTNRVKRIETLGNGQFPLTAAAAFIFGRAILAAVLELIKEHTRHAETGTV